MEIGTERSIFQVQATLTSRLELSPGYFQLQMHAPEIAAAAWPGQFLQIRVAEPGVVDPLLARPISIQQVQPDTGEISVIFKVVGRGTARLAGLHDGSTLCVLGPIGNGFHIPDAARAIALVAGGVGMPPLFFLAETLRRARREVSILCCFGGRSAADLLLLPQWEALNVTMLLATDDGSRGHHGLVTTLLRSQLAAHPIDFLAACGPRPMLRAVQRLAQDLGIAGQLSLEARMACGIGACLGCVCATVAGNRRVCVDGPVFPLDEVNFDG